MVGEWRTLSLRDANVTLIDCDHRTPRAAETGFPYVAIPQLREGRIDLSEARRIAPEDYAGWTRKAKPCAYDVVLSRRCNPGETAVVPPGLEFALGQNLVLLRADGAIVYPPFLRWLVRGPEWWDQIGKFLNVGAVFDSLKCADVPKFELRIPPPKVQRAIAHILGTLDDKIDLNRRMNETLEGIARALFRSWFVDLDLVRTDAGKLPKGWRSVPLPQAIEVNPTRPLAPGARAPYVDMGNMPTTGARVRDWVDREFTSGMRFTNGDVLVARITPCLENGKTAFVDFLAEGQVAWGSTEYIVLRSRPPLPPEYAYFLARSEPFRAYAIANMTGTSGRQRVPTSCLAQLNVVVPAEPAAAAFGRFTAAPMQAMKQRDEESRTLAALRDALLPKLLSGELRVKDAEKFVEART